MNMLKPHFSMLIESSQSVDKKLSENTLEDPRYKLRGTEIFHDYVDEDSDDFEPSYEGSVSSIPFRPLWTFGIDILTKIINLTTKKNEWKICYTVCQLVVIYNHSTRSMEFLMGHQNLITCIAIDESGEWLVSADNGQDNKIIVWDVANNFPVCTIFDPHPEVGVLQIGISQDAKYLVSIGGESNPVIKFWLWTFGNEEPDAIYVAKLSYGPVMHVEFNPNNTMMFVVTFSHVILFCTREKNEIKVKEGHIPRNRMKNFGDYTQSIYGSRTYNCYTVTSRGWAIIWGQSFYKVPYKSLPITNNKMFLRAIRLNTCGIKNICYVDGYIQTLNYNGKICFYDNDLKIVYYANKVELPPAVTICFNLKPRKYNILDYEKEQTTIEEENELKFNRKDTDPYIDKNNNEENVQNKENIVIIKDVNPSFTTKSSVKRQSEKLFGSLLGEYDFTENENSAVLQDYDENISEEENLFEKEIDFFDDYEVYLAKQLPSDFTLQKAPFIVRDFIILTMGGNCAYVDTGKDTVDYFLETNFRSITSIDLNSQKGILVVAYEDGWIYSYEYKSRTLRNKLHIPSVIKNFQGIISSIRYSHKVIGSTMGTIAFLNPITTEPENLPVYNYSTYEILDVIFSEDDQYIAYRDSSNSVTLMKIVPESDTVNWICHGRVTAHRDDITGMLFCRVNRLFTIGKDRLLVEYYVKYSLPGHLDVISQVCILQTGFPVAIMYYHLIYESDNIFFLITTSEHKYLVISEKISALEKTILSPSFDYLIDQVEIVPNTDSNYLVYCCGKYLGLQLLPLSGNPYKRMAIIANSSEFITFRISSCGQHVFTYGLNDNVCVMWSIQFECVEYQAKIGGKHLNPYYCLIEGGKDGWFFKEIMDVFYFIQILHQGDNSPYRRQCSDAIAVVELPNMFRAIGFFPSESDLDNIIYEATNYLLYVPNHTDTEDLEDKISFDNFIKLYLNQRPVHRVTVKEIENAFKVLERNGKLSRSKFVELLCTIGEPFTPLALQQCFATLLCLKYKNKNERKYLFQNILPNEITCSFFLYELLGIEEDNKI